MDRGGDKIMKAYIFSIGENTTKLCYELMTEYGFETVIYQDQTTLWDKLKRFYIEALETIDEEFVRIDADVLPIINPKHMFNYYGWTCAQGFDWYKMNLGAISIHKMTREIIKKCLKNIDDAKDKNRPESHLWRLQDINRHTQINGTHLWGVHGYGQTDQRERIKNLKQSRNQEYDWNLVERIEQL